MPESRRNSLGIPGQDQDRIRLGVVGVIENPSTRLNALREEYKVVAIFDKTGGEAKVCADDVLHLINVLHRITWRYRIHAAGDLLLLAL